MPASLSTLPVPTSSVMKSIPLRWKASCRISHIEFGYAERVYWKYFMDIERGEEEGIFAKKFSQ